jgi:hypothetical protein
MMAMFYPRNLQTSPCVTAHDHPKPSFTPFNVIAAAMPSTVERGKIT